MTKGPARLSFIDGIRALAALFVVFSHAMGEVWPVTRLPGGPILSWTTWMLYGHYAVAVFIVISGFCLMLSVLQHGGTLRGSAWSFYKRRAWRIIPPYYAAIALSLLLIWLWIGEKTGNHWDVSLPVTLFGIIERLILVQNFWSQAQINHALWSIAVEWQIYLVFPLVVLSWRRIGAFATTTIAIAVGYWLALGAPHGRINDASLHFLGLFALGMLSAQIAFGEQRIWERMRTRVPWLLAAIFLWGALIATFWHMGFFASSAYVEWLDLLVGFASLATLVSASIAQHSLLHRALSWQPLVFLGMFSYSLYLIHAPLLQLFWLYALVPLGVSEPLQLALLIAIGIPLILLCSYGFFLLFERPFIRSFKTPSSHAAP